MRLHLIAIPLIILLSATHVSAQPVEIRPAAEVVYYPKAEFSGHIVANERSVISTEINARIIELPIKLGQLINKGALIAEMECRDYQDQYAINQATLAELRSSYQLAVLELKRVSNLQQRQLASQSLTDEATNRKQILNAKIDAVKLNSRLLQRQINRCRITAPFNGVVVKKTVGKGEWLNIGTPVVTLVELDEAEIHARVPLYFTAKDLRSALWKPSHTEPSKVRLKRISAVLDPDSKMQSIWFAAPVDSRIGEQGTLVINSSQPHLPAKYIVQRNGQLGFFKQINNTARFHSLPDAQTGQAARLPEDWQSMNIVVDGQMTLQDGDTIQ